MIAIEDLRLAVALSRCESLSAAARVLNVSPPALSMRLRKLETQLGITLANRDARRLSLTADGERFARESAHLLEQLEALPESFKQRDERLVGTLRLAAPFGYGRQRIAPLLARFAKLHPQMSLHLDLRETPWPDRHDSDAVIHIGNLNDSLWIARPLAQNHRWLCASPAYLEQHGVPSTPDELASHRCICIRENDEDVTLWHLSKGQAKKTLRIARTAQQRRLGGAPLGRAGAGDRVALAVGCQRGDRQRQPGARPRRLATGQRPDQPAGARAQAPQRAGAGADGVSGDDVEGLITSIAQALLVAVSNTSIDAHSNARV